MHTASYGHYVEQGVGVSEAKEWILPILLYFQLQTSARRYNKGNCQFLPQTHSCSVH